MEQDKILKCLNSSNFYIKKNQMPKYIALNGHLSIPVVSF